MYLITHCSRCVNEYAQTEQAQESAFTAYVGEDRAPIKLGRIPPHLLIQVSVSDENKYAVTCNRGHRFTLIYPEERFELLLRSAATAYINGDYRGVVTSATASLERLYEFAFKAMCHHHRIPKSDVGNSWAIIAKQSERQLGAFVGLFLLTTKVTPNVLGNNQVQFRNDVTHNGSFASEPKSRAFAEKVLALELDILHKLKETIPDALKDYYSSGAKNLIEEYQQKVSVYWMSAQTYSITNRVIEGNSDMTFEEMFELIKTERKILEGNS